MVVKVVGRMNRLSMTDFWGLLLGAGFRAPGLQVARPALRPGGLLCVPPHGFREKVPRGTFWAV